MRIRVAQHRPRITLSILMALSGVCIEPACSVAADLAATATYHIEPQALQSAVIQYTQQSGIQITSAADLLKGRQSPGVSGALSATAALRQLLLGTQLDYDIVDAHTVAIRLSKATGEKNRTSHHEPAHPDSEAVRLAQADTAGQAAQPQPQSNAAAGVIDEIIVTANKRAERLIDVPASVTAVSGDTLTSMGASRLEDYVARVPGLVLSNVSFANGSNQLTIRGITTGFGGNPTVGIYIDDSPFGGSNGFGAFQIPDLDPSDLARVEVLRGPQGTLYGAGAMGGLLKYVTTPPDTGRFFGRAEASGSKVDGGGSGYGLRGTANIPLTQDIALRISGYDRKDPGFIDDAVRAVRDVNSTHVYGGRAAMSWRINDGWNAKLSALFQRQTADGSAVVDHDSMTFRPVHGDLQQVKAPGTGESSGKIGAYDLQLAGDLGWATFTSSSSYNRQDVGINLDVTSGYSPLIAANFGIDNGGASILTDGKLDKFTQEIRIASPDAGAPLSWLVGVFYTHEDQDLHQSIVTFDAGTGRPLPGALPSFLDAYVFSTFEEFAGFGNLTYRLNTRLDVSVGLRYSYNKQSQQEELSGLLTGTASIPGRSSDSSVTYLVTPRFHLSDATMLYLRVASGYRPGGPNLAITGVPLSYKPDEVVNYELGMKTELLDRRLSLDLAAFYIDWQDIQFNERNAQGLNYFGNAGAATSKGIEAAATWYPVAGLQLSANVTHTIAELAADLPPGSVVASKGDELPTTPRWNGQFSTDYEFPLWGQWSAVTGASYRYVGESAGYFTSPALPRYVLPSYDVVDLRAGVKNDRWSVTLYAKNIGDSRGQVASYLLSGVNRVSIIQPRTFGIAVASTF